MIPGTDNDPTALSPILYRCWLDVKAECFRRWGWHVFLTQTHRSEPAQEAAFAAGTSRARWRESWHNFEQALAFDFAIVSCFAKQPTRRWVMPGEFDWDPAKLAEVGLLCEVRGLVWGGHFQGIADLPHVQGPVAGRPGPDWWEMSDLERERRATDEIMGRAWMASRR